MSILQAIAAELSWVEIAAAVATLVNVVLVARNSIWNWIWGILAVALYAYVFWSRSLYSSLALQVVYYLPMQFYGWWVWLRCGPKRDNDLPITQLSWPARAFWLALNIPVTFALGYGMAALGAAMSYWDAAATSLSLVAQYLLTRKWIENWALWVAVDVIYIYVFLQQRLYVSTGLYGVLLVLAIGGHLQWRALMRQQAKAGA